MTSLTNNVLTFNNGSIKDVRNELNFALPISVNKTSNFRYNSSGPATATISGSPGQVVTKMVSGYNKKLRISSNEGTWIYALKAEQEQNDPDMLGQIVNLTIYPWSLNSASLGSINSTVGNEGDYNYAIIAVVAYRLY